MRTIAIGSQALMDGFALLGMETYADIGQDALERLLNELVRGKQRALIYLQSDLAKADLPILRYLRSEGGNILISEVPDILSADHYHTPVEQLISRVLGNPDLGELR
jgi:vacuolar-type H+-ATPase subunit F/Vma7